MTFNELVYFLVGYGIGVLMTFLAIAYLFGWALNEGIVVKN